MSGPKSSKKSLNVIAGENIRRLRKSLGISQDAFSELAGVHRTYVGSVERGERNMTLDTLQCIAKALKVSPADLLQEAGDV